MLLALPFLSPQDTYKPRRKYRRQQGAEELLDEESRVHSTLLEYGRYGEGAGLHLFHDTISKSSGGWSGHSVKSACLAAGGSESSPQNHIGKAPSGGIHLLPQC